MGTVGEEAGRAGTTPGRYEIRLRGHLSDALRASFKGFQAELQPAQTILYGTVVDQSALQGLLTRLGAMNLELVEVRRLAGDIVADDSSE